MVRIIHEKLNRGWTQIHTDAITFMPIIRDIRGFAMYSMDSPFSLSVPIREIRGSISLVEVMCCDLCASAVNLLLNNLGQSGLLLFLSV
jgi:hypothetical protein